MLACVVHEAVETGYWSSGDLVLLCTLRSARWRRSFLLRALGASAAWHRWRSSLLR